MIMQSKQQQQFPTAFLHSMHNFIVQGLHDEMAQVELDLLEADAKNRLYQLLGERTRQEHMALDQKVCCCCCIMLAMQGQSCALSQAQ
jgi:hypothetical protein